MQWGYEIWETLLHKTNQPSEMIHQLYVPGVAKPGLLGTEEMKQVRCQKGGIIKYYPHEKGKMRLKKDALFTSTDFIKTYKWFDAGLISYKEILVSNRIAKLILDKAWNGVRFKVVDLV